MRLRRLPDCSVDLIYLDALHTDAALRDDLHAWWPKLRPGGQLLSGDDFGDANASVTGFVRFARLLRRDGDRRPMESHLSTTWEPSETRPPSRDTLVVCCRLPSCEATPPRVVARAGEPTHATNGQRGTW